MHVYQITLDGELRSVCEECFAELTSLDVIPTGITAHVDPTSNKCWWCECDDASLNEWFHSLPVGFFDESDIYDRGNV